MATDETSPGLTIAGEPVLVDCDGEAKQMIDAYLRLEYPFPRPERNFGWQQAEVHRRLSDEYPELPTLKVGQFLYPANPSDYGRGLFLVDWPTLAKIAETAWDSTSPETPIPETAPEEWGKSRNVVELKFRPETDDPTLVLEVYCLAPRKIYTDSVDLWLLPVVDRRYDWQSNSWGESEAEDPNAPFTVWSQLFSAARQKLGIWVETGPTYTEYLGPDKCLSQKDVPILRALEAAAWSFGMRPVFDYYNQITFQTPEDAEALLAQNRNKKPFLLGGDSGKCNLLNKIEFRGRRADDCYLGMRYWHSYEREVDNTIQNSYTPIIYCLFHVHYQEGVIHTALENLFKQCCNGLAAKLQMWRKRQYEQSMPGIQKWDPTGFDRFILWDFSDQITFVRSIPTEWLPSLSVCNWAEQGIEEPIAWARLEADLAPGVEGEARIYQFEHITTAYSEIGLIKLTIPDWVGETLTAGRDVPIGWDALHKRWEPLALVPGSGALIVETSFSVPAMTTHNPPRLTPRIGKVKKIGLDNNGFEVLVDYVAPTGGFVNVLVYNVTSNLLPAGIMQVKREAYSGKYIIDVASCS